MDHIFFWLPADRLGRISAVDIASVKPPYIHFSRQYHEYIFYYILEGELYLREDAQEYHLQENDFLLLDPSRRHVGTQTSACRFLYVHFAQDCRETMEEAESSEEDGLFLPKYHHMETAELVLRSRTVAQDLVEAFRRREAYGKRLAACLLQELVLTAAADYRDSLYRKAVPVRGKVREAIPLLIDYLNECYAQEISGEALASRFHYNFDYLNRQFAKWTGRTIFAYLNAVRVERAEQLLATGFYTTEEVAAQTGFRDVYYFSRVFKKYTGMTPGQIFSQSFGCNPIECCIN